MKRAAVIRTLALSALTLFTAAAFPAEAQADEPLTIWTFVAIDGQKPVSDQTRLAIHSDRIVVSVGCNTLSGSLTVEPGTMTVGPLASNRKHCDGLMEQERAVAALLASSPAFYAENGRLGLITWGHSAELIRWTEDTDTDTGED